MCAFCPYSRYLTIFLHPFLPSPAISFHTSFLALCLVLVFVRDSRVNYINHGWFLGEAILCFFWTFFYYYLWEPTFFFQWRCSYMVSSELLIIVLLFIAIDGLEVGPEWKKFAENLKTKAQKLYLFLSPTLEKAPIKFTCTRNGRLSPMKFYRNSNPTQNKKVFPVFLSYNYFSLSSKTCVFLMTAVYPVLL